MRASKDLRIKECLIVCSAFIIVVVYGVKEKLTKSWVATCFEKHNFYRKLEGKPPLQWDVWGSHIALRKLTTLEKKCSFEPSTDVPYGENLRGGPTRDCDTIVDLWYKRKKFYDPQKPLADNRTLQYTQLVWKDTEYVGCAWRPHCYYKYIVLCYYYPPGNLNAKSPEATIQIFKENVG